MNSNLLILILSTLGFLSGIAITYWIHSQYQMEIVVSPATFPEDIPTPLISVIIPARNEANNIRRCVEALLAQTYTNFEVIVVDDRSTDSTPEILSHILDSVEMARMMPDLRVIQGTALPSGWVGKTHALAQGAAQASTGLNPEESWLCFLDADTFADPNLLASTLHSAQSQEADMFTILTSQELGGFWEKVILPLVFTALSVGFSPRRVNDPNRPDAIANGQFILIRRNIYNTLGGHAAIRSSIVEDKALANLVKRNGYRLIIADGRSVARTRMYTSLSGIWEGWTKNIYLGMRDRLGLLLTGGVIGLFGALVLPLWLTAGVVWFLSTGGLLPAVVAIQSILLWVYLVAVRALAARAFNISPLYALTTPLGALLFTAMMFASAFNVISGRGVSWKGRSYASHQ
jgi:chlorobactene glucosyltransferase